MKVGDKVYVVDWGKQYTSFYTWKNGIRTLIFPIKTEIPDYSTTEYHRDYIYKDNLTQKGTINKREPKILVDTIHAYRNYKYQIIEILKHPNTNKDLFLLKSYETRTSFSHCYVLIGFDGVSILTPEQYLNEKFNAMIEANLGKHDRNTIDRQDVIKNHKDIVSVVYDSQDRVLFGSSTTKGKVEYHYLEGKFSIDKLPIYLGCSVLYDGIGNADLPENAVIMDLNDIKKMIE